MVHESSTSEAQLLSVPTSPAGDCHSTTKLWDIAAGSLLVEEAGGAVVSETKTFNPFHFESFLAGNPALVKKAQTFIR